VCFYRSPGHGQLPVGVLTRGGEVRGAQLTDLVAGLDAGGPASPCSARHSAFAVLRPVDGGEAYVELDGCHRVLAADCTMREADAQLIHLVTIAVG
jgi:hypothetical protein